MFYDFDIPVRIVVGEGCSAQLGESLSTAGVKKVLCVHDKGVAEAGIVAPLIENMEKGGIEVGRFDEVLPDPPMEIVEVGTDVAEKEKPDAIVAIGGGSSIDTAKAVNANYTNRGTLKDHALNLNGLQILPYDNPLKPLYVLPTTAGTGSEVSPTAVVTDKELKLKLSIASRDHLPKVALIDPALMVGMPPAITASTGLDAFSHAVEGLMGGLALLIPSPMRLSFALTAIELTLESLPVALKDGKNMKARTGMAYSAFMSLLGAYGGLSFGHAVGHAIGEVCEIHNHGFLCSLVVPQTVEYLEEFIPEQIAKLASLLKLDPDGKSVKHGLQSFYKECGVPSLKEMGMDMSMVKEVAHHATLGQYYLIAPKKPSEEEFVQWLEEAYEG